MITTRLIDVDYLGTWWELGDEENTCWAANETEFSGLEFESEKEALRLAEARGYKVAGTNAVNGGTLLTK